MAPRVPLEPGREYRARMLFRALPAPDLQESWSSTGGDVRTQASGTGALPLLGGALSATFTTGDDPGDLELLRSTWENENVAIGDLFLRGDDLVSRGVHGRGARVHFGTGRRDRQLFETLVEGSVAGPGWTAELNINGRLVEVQDVAPTTLRYQFLVPLRAGTSRVVVVLYGPRDEAKMDDGDGARMQSWRTISPRTGQSSY